MEKEGKSMKKWLLGFVLALCMVSAAMAGEDPYIAIVGNDTGANPFYFSPKYLQFVYDQELFSVSVCDNIMKTGPQTDYRGYFKYCEQFKSQTPVNQPEICDVTGVVNKIGDYSFYGQPNAKVTAGNSGWFEWFIRLPKKPDGEINLVLQCGVLKPNAFALYDFDAIELCAAETGERVGPNCSRIPVPVGSDYNPVLSATLPMILAEAMPGPYANPDAADQTGVNPFPKFLLTAFRNPGTYEIGDTVLLNGSSSSTRVLLKSCMDKTIVAKLPVDGVLNANGQREYDLNAGDIIHVKMFIPRTNTVDIYCHEQSLKVMGIGESPF